MNITKDKAKEFFYLCLFSFINYTGILITVFLCTTEIDKCFFGIPLDTISAFVIPIIQMVFIWLTAKMYDMLSSAKLRTTDKYALYIISYILTSVSLIFLWILWYNKLKSPETTVLDDPDTVRTILNPVLFTLGIILAELIPLNNAFGKSEKEAEDDSTVLGSIRSLVKRHKRLTIAYIFVVFLTDALVFLFLLHPLAYSIFIHVGRITLIAYFTICVSAIRKQVVQMEKKK